MQQSLSMQLVAQSAVALLNACLMAQLLMSMEISP